MSTAPTTSERTLPSGGWFWLDNSLLDRYGPQLGVYGLAVYLALARCADRQQECRPSYQAIARAVGCSRRQVIREIHRLESLGLVEKIGRASDWGDPSANGYRLLPLPGTVTETPRGGHSQSPAVTDMPRSGDSVSPAVTDMPRSGDSVSPAVTDMPRPGDSVPPVVTDMPRPGDSVSPVVTDMPRPGDSVSPVVTDMPRPGDSVSLGVVTGTAEGSDWRSLKQDIYNKTQEEENPTNKQTPQASEREGDVDATPVVGCSVLFSSSGTESAPALPAEKVATDPTPAGKIEELEQEETLSEQPAATYSLTRFVQITGSAPSKQERGQLLALDFQYTPVELYYIFDALESALQRGEVRYPLAYVQAIAQRQERGRWPGLAATARSQPADAPGRYALPPALTAPRPPAPVEEEPPPIFRRFLDEFSGQLYGSPMAAELRRLSPLAWDGDTLRIGVSDERLTAWLRERATPVVRRAEERISQAQGQALRVEFVWVGGRCAPAAAG